MRSKGAMSTFSKSSFFYKKLINAIQYFVFERELNLEAKEESKMYKVYLMAQKENLVHEF